MTDLTVRCNSCSAKNEIETVVAPDTYEQYGAPHIDLPSGFSCAECGRWHLAGISVELVVTDDYIPTNDAEDRYNRKGW